MKEKKYEILRDHPLRKLTKDALSLSKNGKFISTLTDVDITDAKSALREMRRSGKTNISVAALSRLAPIFLKAKANKIIYSNATLTTAEKAAINNFMSKPENY